MSQVEFVRIGSSEVSTLIILPAIERIGMRHPEMNYSRMDGIHASAYAIGLYGGITAGMRFGGKLKYYAREEKGLSKLSHVGIPRCLAVGQLEIPDRTLDYMIVNHFSATPIANHIDFSSSPAKEESVGMLLRLVDLIDYIHSRGVVHQDIASDHVLVDVVGQVHLIDFHIWDETTKGDATSDFCGWRTSLRLPSVLQDMIFGSGVLFEHNEIDRNPTGFGALLREVIPFCKAEEPLLGKLRNIEAYLSSKSDEFIRHPKSRDFISGRLKRMLNELHS